MYSNVIILIRYLSISLKNTVYSQRVCFNIPIFNISSRVLYLIYALLVCSCNCSVKIEKGICYKPYVSYAYTSMQGMSRCFENQNSLVSYGCVVVFCFYWLFQRSKAGTVLIVHISEFKCFSSKISFCIHSVIPDFNNRKKSCLQAHKSSFVSVGINQPYLDCRIF